jgi:hypothetical protein
MPVTVHGQGFEGDFKFAVSRVSYLFCVFQSRVMSPLGDIFYRFVGLARRMVVGFYNSFAPPRLSDHCNVKNRFFGRD